MTKGHRSIGAYCTVFFLVFPGTLMTELIANNFLSASQELLTPAEGEKTNHFKFKSLKVGDKMITVVSLKLDPERGRRSILVPDGEGLLHPASFAHLRHTHRFIPPFEDVEQLPLLNKSINWGDPVAPPKKLTSIEELEAMEEKTNKVLEELETSLTHIEESLKEEKEKEKKAQREERRKKKRKDNRDNSNRKKRKEEKKEYKLKMKERRRENKSEKRTEKGKQNRKQNKSRQKMVGDEACQYKMLRKCAKKLSLLPRKDVQIYSDFQKCSHRKRFLECVEKRREKQFCKARTVARGNLSGLRTWLKKAFWTANSCLLNEALKGR